MNEVTLTHSNVPELTLLARGKVRDIYDLGDALLIVATDRISCFDVVLPTPIPDKSRVLTQMSRFWFQQTGAIVRKTSEKYREALRRITGSQLSSLPVRENGDDF